MGPPGMQWWPGGRMIANAAGALLLLLGLGLLLLGLGLPLLLGPSLLLPLLLFSVLPWRCWLAATTLSISARAAPAACWWRMEEVAGASMLLRPHAPGSTLSRHVRCQAIHTNTGSHTRKASRYEVPVM